MDISQRRYLHSLAHLFRPSPFARLVLATLACFCVAGTASASPAAPLRIGLVGHLKGVSTIDVSCSTDFNVTIMSRRPQIIKSTYLEPVTIIARQDGIEVKKADDKTFKASDNVRLAPVKSDGLLTVSAPTRSFSQYRGTLEVTKIKDSGLLLINDVSLEDYILGVLPAEMPDSFQMEALKAQAVAARTYSERSRGRHSASGFDLCDTVHCQVYNGSAGEKPRTSKAALETAGLVARYNGEMIWAAYSADCGGRTQNGDNGLSGKRAPYLKSILDSSGADQPDFCSTNKSHEWTKIYAPEDIEALLNKRLTPPIEGLQSISFLEYDESGRVSRVEIIGENGSRSVTGEWLRETCGWSNIRSVKMTVSATEDGQICFAGKGWGHGRGLCQWGAEGLAREPHKFAFEQILKHYYTGIEITKLP